MWEARIRRDAVRVGGKKTVYRAPRDHQTSREEDAHPGGMTALWNPRSSLGLLSGDLPHGAQSPLAGASDIKTEAFRMVVPRLRKRLRQWVEAEIA